MILAEDNDVIKFGVANAEGTVNPLLQDPIARKPDALLA